MESLTPAQKNKLLAVAEIVEYGDIAVLKKIMEFGDELETNTKKIDDAITTITNGQNDIATFKETTTKEVKSEIDNIKKEAGAKGEQGEDGKDGTNGKDGKDGRDGKDGENGENGSDGKDGTNGKDGSSDNGEQIIDKINSDDSEKQIKYEKVEGLEDRFTQVTRQISSIPRGGSRSNNSTKFYDLSALTDGMTKVFTVPKSVTSIVLMSDAPFILMKNNGFSLNATTTQLTLTTQNAPSQGSQLIYQYSSIFNT